MGQNEKWLSKHLNLSQRRRGGEHRPAGGVEQHGDTGEAEASPSGAGRRRGTEVERAARAVGGSARPWHAGLPHMRYHDLRHSAASFLAAQGVPITVAKDILGHSDIRLTANIYTHVLDAAKEEAADALDRLFARPELRPAPALTVVHQEAS